MAEARQKTIAVVLAGAVAKGSFEAGALRELLRRDVKIVRIVAASSGALNGAVLAAGIRSGTEREAVERLVTLWQEDATLWEGFNIKPFTPPGFGGISGPERLRKKLEKHAPVCTLPPAARRPIDLRIVVSPLAGDDGQIGAPESRPEGAALLDAYKATTFEKVLKFEDECFDDENALGVVFDAALASSSFPLVFKPVELNYLPPQSVEKDTRTNAGPCVDGGTVNNTPIKYALGAWGDEPPRGRLDAVVVIAPSVQHEHGYSARGLPGVPPAARIADMLIGERLYRDLHDAEDMNRALRALDGLVTNGTLTAAQRDDVKRALQWTHRYPVKIVPIRPEAALQGNAFSALVHPRYHHAYIAEGEARARCALTDFDLRG